MAKNTYNTQFRKLNVNVDSDEEEEEVPADAGGGPNVADVSNLLAEKRNVDALTMVLREAPVTTKNQQLKDQVFDLVMKVLASFKQNEIDGAINALDATLIDVLMKYIYRGFESPPNDNMCGPLLQWHEKTFAAGGLGSIVRVLTDRKKV